MAGQYQIEIVRGDTFEFDVTFTDIGTSTITGLYFSCKRRSTDEEYVFQKSIGHGITDEGSGRYHVRVAPEDTYDIKAGQYAYDLQVCLNDSDVYTLLMGSFMLKRDVTEETV